MGFKNSSVKSDFVRFKDGKFFLAKDKDNSFEQLEATISGFYFTDDEFQGNTIRKLNIKMFDDSNNYILSLIFNSVPCSQLISFLKNADLTKRLTLVGTLKEEDGRKKVSILVKQDGKFLKSFFSKATPNGMPQMKKVTINKKDQWDKSEMMDFLEGVVTNELAKSVPSDGNDRKPTETTEKASYIEDDDLPF